MSDQVTRTFGRIHDLPHRRVMHRATILGDRPYFDPKAIRKAA